MAPQDPNAPTDSNGTGLLITAIVTLAVAWPSVALRTYVRAVMMKSFQIDDWIMLAGLANFTVSCIFVFVGLAYGMGRHNKSLSQHDEIEALKYQALAAATYVLNMWLIKLSIGLFLFRLAVRDRYRWILGVSIVVVSVWSLTLLFLDVFQCDPVAAQWDYRILAADPKSHCLSAEQIVQAAYALSALTVLSDWLYALIPIPMVWQVKMTPQAKWSVIAVLSLGVFASIATLVRLAYLADITDIGDILFAATDVMIWTLIEPGLAITAASLATIRPLLRSWGIGGFTHSERSRLTTTGARSQDQASSSRLRKGPAANGKMPGFGPHDVTLVDMESGLAAVVGKVPSPSPPTTTTINFARKLTQLPRVFAGDDRRGTRDDDNDNDDDDDEESPAVGLAAAAARRGGLRRSETRSEVFILDGAMSTRSLSDTQVTNGAWLDGESDGSSVELHRPAKASPPRPSRRP